MVQINEKLEASNQRLTSRINELKDLSAESFVIREQYHQACIEIERIIGENRSLEDLRRGDRDQILTLTEKTAYLVPSLLLLCFSHTLQTGRVNHFEKLSADLALQLSHATEVQLQQTQIAQSSQKLSIKLQGTVDQQQKTLETLRVSLFVSPLSHQLWQADKSDLRIELETLKEESSVQIEELEDQNEKFLADKEVYEFSFPLYHSLTLSLSTQCRYLRAISQCFASNAPHSHQRKNSLKQNSMISITHTVPTAMRLNQLFSNRKKNSLNSLRDSQSSNVNKSTFELNSLSQKSKRGLYQVKW
jgi:hypothetical protein